MTIRCFRWDDAGAPQLGAASSLSVVLEKCLVDGYGTQAGLGWGKIKSPSGKVIAFRPPARASSRPWLFFDDRCSDWQYGFRYNGAACVALYDELKSIDDNAGVNAEAKIFLSDDIGGIGNSYINYRNKNNDIKKWVVISDSEQNWFYLLLENYIERGKDAFVLRAFGALNPVNNGDVFNFVYTSDSVNSWEYSRAGIGGNESYYRYVDSISFVGNSSTAKLYVYSAHGGIGKCAALNVISLLPGVQNPGWAGLIKHPNGVSNKLTLIDCSALVFTANPSVASSMRGKLSGLYAPLNDSMDLFGVKSLSQFPEEVDGLPGRKLMAINVLSPYVLGSPDVYVPISSVTAMMFFDLTGPWA